MSILILPAPVVNFDFAELAPAADDYRPTLEPDFIPTPEEQAEAAVILNNPDDDFGPTDADWDAMAEAAYVLDLACCGPIF